MIEVRYKTADNPYHRALHLHGLVKAANSLVRDGPDSGSRDNGLSEMLAVMEDFSGALVTELDAGAFCEAWPQLAARLEQDGTLGLEG